MPMRLRLPIPLVLALVGLSLAGAPARAQEGAGHAGHGAAPDADSSRAGARGDRWHLMLQAIPVLTHAAHTVGDADLTEGYLAQTVLMTRGTMLGGRLQLDATLNGEGLTMQRGELSTGGFGEGYVDRRHPHAYLHELIVTGAGRMGQLAYSASAGRGFAPFGTDDPMMRPFEKYPLNHHLAQILERSLLAGAVRWESVMLEGGLFGGDEPSSPSALPRPGRFGDSWSVRVTAMPSAGAEVQASYARVTSPEQEQGFGLDQRKRSVSARLVSRDGRRYLLAEWARTIERDGDRGVDVFGYETALAEGAVSLGPVGLGLRLEQTERPEEDRLSDPFRTPRPAPDLAILGITRWRATTLAVTLPSVTQGVIRGYPFVELARFSARSRLATSIFSPEKFYGPRAPWMGSIGFRLRYGPPHARMGRYGAALPDGAAIRMLGAPAGRSSGHGH
jgi:hypothetical protein